MISYEEALKMIKPQCKMHDVISASITSSGGSSSATFQQNACDILIYRSVFTLWDSSGAAGTGSTRAINQIITARDIYKAKITLTKEKTTFNPVDVFAWNDMNTDNVNGYYWLVRNLDNLKVEVTHSIMGATAANNFPVTWEFAIQYYELRG